MDFIFRVATWQKAFTFMFHVPHIILTASIHGLSYRCSYYELAHLSDTCRLYSYCDLAGWCSVNDIYFCLLFLCQFSIPVTHIELSHEGVVVQFGCGINSEYHCF